MKSLGLVIQFQFTIEQIPRSPWLDLFVYLSISLCLAPVYEVWCIGIVYVNATLLGLSYFGESELYHSLFVWILSFIIILVNLNVSKILEIFRVVLFKNVVSEENCLKRPIQWQQFSVFAHQLHASWGTLLGSFPMWKPAKKSSRILKTPPLEKLCGQAKQGALPHLGRSVLGST